MRTISGPIRAAARISTVATAIATFAVSSLSAQSPAQAASKTCRMLSESKLSALWGVPMHVKPGVMDIPQAQACDWSGPGYGDFLTVRIVPARYFPDPSHHIRGFKSLRGVGDANAAYVYPELGGWTAGALKGKKAVVIQVSGPKTNAGTAETLIRTLVPQI